jgi:hypothetical protein
LVEIAIEDGTKAARVLTEVVKTNESDKPCVDGACVARGFWRFDDLVVGSHVFGFVMRPHDRGP